MGARTDEMTIGELATHVDQIVGHHGKTSLKQMEELAASLAEQALVMRQLSNEMWERSQVLVTSTNALTAVLKEYISNGTVDQFLEKTKPSKEKKPAQQGPRLRITHAGKKAIKGKKKRKK